ncbi:hypothetical protein PVAP13_7NG137217, partial [Panicum virgatum]
DNLNFEVSLLPAQPPLPTNLFVCCPGVKPPPPPPPPNPLHSRRSAALPYPGRRRPSTPSLAGYKGCNYFVYRPGVGAEPPALTLIPDPNPNVFHDGDVGILPRGGDLFTVAALVVTSNRNEYRLRRFDSEAGTSPSTPAGSITISQFTTTTITLGGDAGTMGWVDLWSGILLYDLLRDGEGDQDGRPTLRHMPVPVPMHAITCNRGAGAKLGCPRAHRGITVATKSGKACLKFADLQTIGGRLPYRDVETMLPEFEVDDGIITTWSNKAMGCSFEDWHEDFTVRGSEIKISGAVRAELLSSGLLHRKPTRDDGEEPAMVELALQNLVVSEPTPSQNGYEDVLYLMARTKLFSLRRVGPHYRHEEQHAARCS